MARAGRPEHAPTVQTRLKVQLAALLGLPHHDIAKAISTGTRQLLKHYREELDCGKNLATLAVAGELYKSAMTGNVAAQIFWMKAKAGWRETQQVNVKDERALADQIATKLAIPMNPGDAATLYVALVTAPASPAPLPAIEHDATPDAQEPQEPQEPDEEP